MTTIRQLACLAAMCAALALARPAPALAQLNSNEATATLTAVLPESLTVTLLPGATAFALTSGSAVNAATLTLSATTSWTLALSRTDLTLYGYFSSSGAALAHTFVTNTVDIPSSRVEVSVNGGALTAFDQTVAFGAANAGRQLWTQAVGALTASGTRTDTLDLNINLSGLAMPADTYTGTLRIRAQATP
jgi:hypothetical protein